jgi:hypothetical protein
VRKLFKGGNYLRAETIHGNAVFGNSGVEEKMLIIFYFIFKCKKLDFFPLHLT